MTEGVGQKLIDIPKMPLLCSRSQICILLSGVECQYKCSVYTKPGCEGVGEATLHFFI